MKKMTLEEVTRELRTELFDEKIYQNKDGFHYPEFGKCSPSLTFILPEYWYVDKFGEVINPYNLQKCPEFVQEQLNLNFKNVNLRWGKFFISKNGKECFRLTTIREATHVFLHVYWKRSPWFFQYRDEESIKAVGAVHYKLSKADGRSGYEYWVFPTRLLSKDDLSRIAEQEIERLQGDEKKYYKRLEDKQNSIKNKPIFEKRLIRCNERLAAENLPLVRLEDEQFAFLDCTKYYYTEENCQMVEKYTEEAIHKKKEKQEQEKEKEVIFEKFDRLLIEKDLKQYSRDYKGEYLIIEYYYSVKNVVFEKFEYTEDGLEKLKNFQL